MRLHIKAIHSCHDTSVPALTIPSRAVKYAYTYTSHKP